MKNATKHADDLKSLLKRLTEGTQARAAADAGAAQGAGPRRDELRRPRRPGRRGDEGTSRRSSSISTSCASPPTWKSRNCSAPLPRHRAARGDDHPVAQHIFESEHTLSLDRLNTLSKRDARQFLRELPEMHPFVEAYVMLFAFDGHAVPVDDEIARLPPRARRRRGRRRRSTTPRSSSSTISRPRSATTSSSPSAGRPPAEGRRRRRRRRQMLSPIRADCEEMPSRTH